MTPYRFFLTHAGYSYGPAERPIDGRQRCARALAAAERRAAADGLTFEWREDDQPFECSCDDPACESHDPHVAYGCILRDADGLSHGSLWGISFGPDGGPYREPYARVVEAELASEYYAERKRYRVHLGGRQYRYFTSVTAANDLCEQIRRSTGLVLSIVQA